MVDLLAPVDNSQRDALNLLRLEDLIERRPMIPTSGQARTVWKVMGVLRERA